MGLVKKIILLGVLVFSTAALSINKVQSDSEYWPYPWGTECPFPWDTISLNDWSFMINDSKVHVSFHVTRLDNDKMKLVTIAYDQNSKLIAYSDEYFTSEQQVLILELEDLSSVQKKHFTLLVRVYDNRLKVSENGYFDFNALLPERDKKIYCDDTQLTELAVTVTTRYSCQFCKNPIAKHQIAQKISKD